jgi:hypothetical protein
MIREVDSIPLSASAADALKRARVLLFGVKHTGRRVAAMLAGYSPDQHREGAYLVSQVSGERSFAEWRQLRSLRPPSDPALPDLVETVEALAMQWLARAREAAERVADVEDRAEVLTYLTMDSPYASRTWRAKAAMQRVRGIGKHLGPYTEAWAALDTRALDVEGAMFDAALTALQESVKRAPLGDDELADIHRAREDAALRLRAWLEERADQLVELGEVELTILGLGEEEPPDGFDPPIALLVGFEAAAKA